jgi:hypothetical protein
LCFGGGTYYTIDSANEYTMHSTEHSRHGPTSTRNALFGSFTYCPQYQFQVSQITKAIRLNKYVEHGFHNLKIINFHDRLLAKAEENGEVTFEGETWTYEEIKMLIMFIHHSCQRAKTFSGLAGFPLKYEFNVKKDETLKQIEFDPIVDDVTNSVITEKIIPFVQKVLLLI